MANKLCWKSRLASQNIPIWKYSQNILGGMHCEGRKQKNDANKVPTLNSAVASRGTTAKFALLDLHYQHTTHNRSNLQLGTYPESTDQLRPSD